MVTDSETALRVLLDKQEIHEVQMRYCRGIDRLDEDLLRSVYFPDAWDDHSSFVGAASEFIPYITKRLREGFNTHMHYICNELFEVDGDVAHGESYYYAVHSFERDGVVHDLTAGGRYIDRFERREGRWGIARRLVVVDWNRTAPALEILPSKVTGSRDRNDPVYMRD
jgi:hypothetical protein